MRLIDYLNSCLLPDAIKEKGAGHIREDLQLAMAVHKGEHPGIEFTYPYQSWADPVSFKIGKTHIWAVKGYWQIADHINNQYRNHRGFSPSLEETLNFVLNEGK